MLKVKSTTTIYKMSLEELAFLFQEQLGNLRHDADIKIEPSYRWAGYGPQEEQIFDGLTVTVTEKR